MAGERILIFEDDTVQALDFKIRLERRGYSVIGPAETPEEAVDLAGAECPDLALMDIRYQDDDWAGIRAGAEIRSRHSIPVVFITAFADQATVERAKSAEPLGYLIKPVKERDLHTTIDVALYKSRAERELQRQERLFSAILNSASDGIIATDAAGTIRFMNPVAETLTGWTQDAARDRSLSEVFVVVSEGAENPIDLRSATAASHSGPHVFESVRLLNRRGARVHIEGSVSDIHGDHGRVEGQTLAFRDVTEFRRLNETVRHQAKHDALTGLINRDEFAARLAKIAARAEAEDLKHSFLFIDIDQFKLINDMCGHLAGDELLCQVADGIHESVAAEHVLGRLGGDQFGLLVLDADSVEGTRVASGLVRALSRKFVWQQNSYNITVSIGVAPVSRGNSTVNDILAAGDDACVLVKEHGGNGTQTYQTADFIFLKRKGEMQWISRLTSALDEHRFSFYHQEIVSLRDSGERKCEILLRLREPGGKLVSPGEFITAAERYKLMPSIDKWVITEACRYVERAKRRGLELPVICINLSGSSLADNALLDHILSALDGHELDASCFCLEVTETNAIQNFARAITFMKRLRDEGATFALDDFGNGFSSFSYLKRLPVDYLKIDGSFVQDIETDPIDLAMLKSVNTIGHTMGMQTIAEYVHNDAIRTMLGDIGVDFAQGYAISEPRPLPYARELLEEREPDEV